VDESIEDHCATVVREMVRGRVIPVLGAGVNLYGRPPGTAWVPGTFLPSADELTRHLAERFGYPRGETLDLVRVSEYASVMLGSGPLYDELHQLFDANYPIGPVQQFLAELPRRLRQANRPGCCPLIITTNYDDALERAFGGTNGNGEPFDLVSYIADGDHRGKFAHWPPGGRPTLIEIPNQYSQLKPGEQAVILKIHGAVDRGPDAEWDSYVITEDHYIDYLARTEIHNLVPVKLTALLSRSHFLFLGYSMRDWNLRVILHRIWGEQKLRYNSWAIQHDPDQLDRKFWEKRGVDVLDVPLEEYVPALTAALETELGQQAGQQPAAPREPAGP
jgi:hypothetical protein